MSTPRKMRLVTFVDNVTAPMFPNMPAVRHQERRLGTVESIKAHYRGQGLTVIAIENA